MPKIVGWKNRTIKTFGVGLSEELECVTEANPPANVTWVHISQNSSRVVSHMERSILKFESVEKKDAGEYECIASNEFGVKKQTMFIQIVGDGMYLLLAPYFFFPFILEYLLRITRQLLVKLKVLSLL